MASSSTGAGPSSAGASPASRKRVTGSNSSPKVDREDSLAELSEALQNFVLRDLDTGKTRLITDDTVVEEADHPGHFIRAQSMAENRRAAARAAATAAILMDTTISDDGGGGPISPRTLPRRSSSTTKRTQSDELLSIRSRAMRSADLVRVNAYKKRERDFAYTYRWQSVVNAHIGPIRVIKFNSTGRLLATAGYDRIIKIWEVDARVEDKIDVPIPEGTEPNLLAYQYQREYLRRSRPVVELHGHTEEIVDLAWSKNNFLCSGGMDGTIRLWHPTKPHCLRVFTHPDIVTTICFHPSDEQVCISGSADGALRLWHLKESKLLSVAEVDDIITACVIASDGATVLVGTLHGRVKFFSLFDEIQGEWQFVHTTQLDVRSRRLKKGVGKKVAGLCFRPGGGELCVSSSDSRIRLYRMDDKACLTKFVGHVNEESQLCASFSPCGTFVLTASENRTVCIWEVNNQGLMLKPKPDAQASASATAATAAPTKGKRPKSEANNDKGKNISMESFDPHDNVYLSAACFAPRKARVPSALRKNSHVAYSRRAFGLVMVTASEEGVLRVFGCI